MPTMTHRARPLELRRLASALLPMLLLAGCSLTPDYQRPAAPVGDSFPLADKGSGAAAAATAAPDLPWPQFFAEPRLQALIRLALQNNRDLRIAVLNAETARATLAARRADIFPTVNATLTGSRQPSPFTGGLLSIYTAGLAVSNYELDLFGRLRSISDQAAAQYLASEEGARAAQVTLLSSLASAYYALQADEALLAVTRDTLASRGESLRLTKLRTDNGVSSELDLRLAEGQLAAARATLASAERQRQQDLNALVLLVGQPLPADLPPPGGWSAQALSDVPAGLPSEVLLRRPDVRQAESSLMAANANIGAARAAFFPRVLLTAQVGTASSHLADLGQASAWSLAPQLLLPIFDFGRNRANLRAAEGQRAVAVAQYERAIQSAFREVANALANRSLLAEQLDQLAQQTATERRRLELTELRQRNGVASSLELLDAQRSLFALQQQQLQLELSLVQSRISAYSALGGGWSADAVASAAPTGR
jgi:multidrug efflux system outer membrane protein